MEIIDVAGNKIDIDCMACNIRDGKVTLPVERIVETKNFVVEQDLEIPIEGFLVVVSKRHVLSIDEMTDSEVQELALLLKKTRTIMRNLLNITTITVLQEENTVTSHFHVWLFPWHKWMIEKWGGKAEEMKNAMRFAKSNMLTKENLEILKKTANKLKNEFK